MAQVIIGLLVGSANYLTWWDGEGHPKLLDFENVLVMGTVSDVSEIVINVW